MKYVSNGSEYDSASLENTNDLSSEKKSASHKNYYENVYDKDKVKEDTIKFFKKINDF